MFWLFVGVCWFCLYWKTQKVTRLKPSPNFDTFKTACLDKFWPSKQLSMVNLFFHKRVSIERHKFFPLPLSLSTALLPLSSCFLVPYHFFLPPNTELNNFVLVPLSLVLVPCPCPCPLHTFANTFISWQ